MLKVPRALTTIHMIGQRPKTAPSSAESATCPTGIEYTASATIIETPSATSDAHCAFIRNTPSNTNSTTRGRTAKIEVTPSEWDTGSNTCLYTAHLLVHPPRRVPRDQNTPPRRGSRRGLQREPAAPVADLN